MGRGTWDFLAPPGHLPPLLHVLQVDVRVHVRALPLAVVGTRRTLPAGGLIAFGPAADEYPQLAARYADQILRGAKPADLPVEQTTRFNLVVNLKAAKALGLTIPQAVLLRADEIIE